MHAERSGINRILQIDRNHISRFALQHVEDSLIRLIVQIASRLLLHEFIRAVALRHLNDIVRALRGGTGAVVCHIQCSCHLFYIFIYTLLDKRLQRFVLVAAKHRCAHCGTDQRQPPFAQIALDDFRNTVFPV